MVPRHPVAAPDTGHFALEEKLPEVAPIVTGFLSRQA
jgi:hypothetical protein